MYEAGKHCSFIPQATREIVFDTKLRYENFGEILGSIITLRRRYKFSLFVCQSLYSSSSGQKAVHSRTDVSDLKKWIIRTTSFNDMTSDRKGLSESVFIDSIKFVTAGYHTNLENKKKRSHYWQVFLNIFFQILFSYLLTFHIIWITIK